MGVWSSEPALEVIVRALREAAEARLARVDGSCADCTDDKVCADHVGDVDAAMLYHETLEAIAEGAGVESILADLHPDLIGGVEDVGRIRPMLQARPHGGTPLGQLTIAGDAVDQPRLVGSEHGPAAIMRVRLAAIAAGDVAMASWLSDEPVVIDVIAYGPLAVNVARSVTKGTPVDVTGTYRLAWPAVAPHVSDQRTASRSELVASSVAVSLRTGTAIYSPRPSQQVGE